MAKWVLLRSGNQIQEMADYFQVDPMIIQILNNRKVSTKEQIAEFLSEDISAASEYDGLPNLEQCLKVLETIKQMGLSVRIIGDYDVDGVMSTVILHKGLKAYGISTDYVIPHRVMDGYGLSENLIEKAYEDGIRVIITCDNGISAVGAIEKAKKLGMTVIITDHHEVPKDNGAELFPPADVIVDSKMQSCTYPTPEICGAQVAYKIISALLGFNQKNEALSDDLKLLKKELLIFSGFACLEDVMPLIGENRHLVRFAIKNAKNSPNLGLQVLIKLNNLEEKELRSYHVGFILGPCINATGRLDTAKRAVDLFLSDSASEIESMGSELLELNKARKEMTVEATENAIDMVESEFSSDKVLVVYLPKVHESIAGIVAGRIREKFNKPTIVLTNSGEDVKGSGRSIEAYNMFEKLSEHKELYKKFGGHKMAAGLTLKEGCVEEFRLCLNRDSNLTEEDLIEKLRIDSDQPFSSFNVKMVEQLDLLEPFGPGNEMPVFAAKNVRICSLKRFGKENNYLMINVQQGNRRCTLKTFRDADGFETFLKEKYGEGVLEELRIRDDVVVHLAFYPQINEFNGNVSVDFQLKSYL